MPDNRSSIVLMLLQKLLRSGKSNLVDILLHLFLRHPDTAVRHRQRPCRFVSLHPHLQTGNIPLKLAGRRQHLQFLGGIHRIGNNLP